MAAEQYQLKNLLNVPPEIKLALRDCALERELTISDLVTDILAERYGGVYAYAGEKRTMGVDLTSKNLFIKLPAELITRVYYASRAHQITGSALIILAIADYFGIPYAPTRRGGGRPKTQVSAEEATG